MTTPSELYALKPQSVSHELHQLWGISYIHVPEVSECDAYEISALNEGVKRVERRILRSVDYDHRRFWELSTVWFDGEPVMIVQNAGREGDDHSARFVTDSQAYREMVIYLRSLVPDNAFDADVVDKDADRDDLISFYGDSFIVPKAEA